MFKCFTYLVHLWPWGEIWIWRRIQIDSEDQLAEADAQNMNLHWDQKQFPSPPPKKKITFQTSQIQIDSEDQLATKKATKHE